MRTVVAGMGPLSSAGEPSWHYGWSVCGPSALARACERHQGQLLPHLRSADSARDLELLRQALGEPTLRLRAGGVASLIGATYANLYPRTLGALVLDGAVDPYAWGDNGNPLVMEGTDFRLERDLGTGATLVAFVRRCAAVGRPRCAFAPSAGGGPEAGGDQRLQTVPADGSGGGWEGAARFLDYSKDQVVLQRPALERQPPLRSVPLPAPAPVSLPALPAGSASMACSPPPRAVPLGPWCIPPPRCWPPSPMRCRCAWCC